MPATPIRRGLLRRLWMILTRADPRPEETAALRARWPHRTGGWLDPNVPLDGWRSRIDIVDAGEALRAIAESSDGRIDAAGVAEVLDAMAADRGPAAFRFGPPTAFRQIWVGAAPEETGGVRLFLLSDLNHVQTVAAALSLAEFHRPEKRAELDGLRRFLGALWEWRGAEAPAAVRLEGQGAAAVAARIHRLAGDPGSPALELLRGLRLRAREMVDELSGLDAESVAAADAWLSARGAPTLSEVRRSLGG
jgi:hypothetical protein